MNLDWAELRMVLPSRSRIVEKYEVRGIDRCAVAWKVKPAWLGSLIVDIALFFKRKNAKLELLATVAT